MAVIRGNLFTTQLLVNHGADTKTLSKVLYENDLLHVLNCFL
jgi:hypothetical protein